MKMRINGDGLKVYLGGFKLWISDSKMILTKSESLKNDKVRILLILICPVILSLIKIVLVWFSGGNLEPSGEMNWKTIFDSLGALFFTPLFEEYLFRYYPSKLVKNKRKLFYPVILSTSLLFALVHGLNFLYMPMHFVSGLLYFVICYRYSVKESIIAHIIHNFPLVVIPLLYLALK